MTSPRYLGRSVQLRILQGMVLCAIAMGVLGIYALRSAPTLFVDSQIVAVREGITITRIGDVPIAASDLWKLPAFMSPAREAEWWRAQRRLGDVLARRQSVVIGFMEEKEAHTSWELIADVGRMSLGAVLDRVWLIDIVGVIYLFAALSMFRRHTTTAGFLSAFFFASTGLYLVCLAPVVHRPILLDAGLLDFLIKAFFVASTGQIAIVHLAMVFPRKKRFLRRAPTLVSLFYVYSATISVLYLMGLIALASTLPLLFIWIAVMLGGFAHSLFNVKDIFLQKQVSINLMAPLLVATFFTVSVVLPWSAEGTLVNNYALFSLMLPFALLLSLDNQRLYADWQISERSSRLEKERIHRELHDTVLNDLASISIVTEGALRFLGTDPAKAGMRLDKIKEYAADSSRQLRNFLWVIDDRQNTWEDIEGSLRKLGYDLLNPFDIFFVLDSTGKRHGTPPPTPAAKHAIFQIFREALINVSKHAHAKRVTAALKYDDARVAVSIADDGVGFEPEQGGEDGHGLSNIKHRIDEAHGEFTIDSRPGGGTRLHLTLPIV